MSVLRWAVLVCVLALAACGGGGGGFSSDGGVSGTGISAVTGNVAAITGDPTAVGGILVRVDGEDLTAITDDAGFFTLRGEIEGERTLVFERPDDGLAARVAVQVPAGGTLELADVVLDAPSGEARPARRRVDFRARVDGADCGARVLFVVSRFAAERSVFVVALDRMVLRAASGAPARCEDLTAGRAVDVTGLVQDDGAIADGTLVLVAEEPTPTATRLAATPTARAPTARPSTPTPARSPGVVPTTTRAAPGPTLEPSARPLRPTPTATRLPPRATPTPTRVRPSPTATRAR